MRGSMTVTTLRETLKKDPQYLEAFYYVMPPQCGGQMVDVTYAFSDNGEGIIERSYDKHDRTISYRYVRLSSSEAYEGNPDIDFYNYIPRVKNKWWNVGVRLKDQKYTKETL